jgi:hypothetical protein
MYSHAPSTPSIPRIKALTEIRSSSSVRAVADRVEHAQQHRLLHVDVGQCLFFRRALVERSLWRRFTLLQLLRLGLFFFLLLRLQLVRELHRDDGDRLQRVRVDQDAVLRRLLAHAAQRVGEGHLALDAVAAALDVRGLREALEADQHALGAALRAQRLVGLDDLEPCLPGRCAAR